MELNHAVRIKTFLNAQGHSSVIYENYLGRFSIRDTTGILVKELGVVDRAAGALNAETSQMGEGMISIYEEFFAAIEIEPSSLEDARGSDFIPTEFKIDEMGKGFIYY